MRFLMLSLVLITASMVHAEQCANPEAKSVALQGLRKDQNRFNTRADFDIDKLKRIRDEDGKDLELWNKRINESETMQKAYMKCIITQRAVIERRMANPKIRATNKLSPVLQDGPVISLANGEKLPFLETVTPTTKEQLSKHMEIMAAKISGLCYPTITHLSFDTRQAEEILSQMETSGAKYNDLAKKSGPLEACSDEDKGTVAAVPTASNGNSIR